MSDSDKWEIYLGPKRKERKTIKETEIFKPAENLKKRYAMFKDKKELREWVISLKFREGDMLRVRICKPYIRGCCDLTEVSFA